jgi:hypothetical protein
MDGDGAIVFVSNPPEHAQLPGPPSRRLTEADALDAPGEARADRAGPGSVFAGGAPSVDQDDVKIAHTARLEAPPEAGGLCSASAAA